MKSLIVLLLLVSASFAQEFPLELLHEFEIPEADPPWAWDVRYWMSDFLPGWAVLREDTIFYKTDIFQPDLIFYIPDAYPCDCDTCRFEDPYEFFCDGNTGLVQLLRWPSLPDHIVFSIVYSIWHDYQDGHTAFLIWDATENTLLYDKMLANSSGDSWHWNLTQTYAELAFLPELPAATEVISWVTRTDYYWNNMGGGGGDHDFGYARIGIINGNSLIFAAVPAGVWSLCPFARSDPLTFACQNYDYYHQDGLPSVTIRALSTANVAGIWTRDTLDVTSVLAQIDHSGTKRIIIDYSQAYSSPSHALLWENDAMGDEDDLFFSARCGSIDERIWVSDPTMTFFSIYDASDGSVLGITSSIEGEPQYMIKSNPVYDQLVSYSEDTHVVHIYKAPHEYPLDLTLRPVANGTMLQVDWLTIPNANSYTLWHKIPPFDTPYFIGTTTDTSMTIPMPEAVIGFYYVEVTE